VLAPFVTSPRAPKTAKTAVEGAWRSASIKIAFAALLVSISSLGVSLVTTYHTTYSPFTPAITIGSPVFHFGHATGDNPGLTKGVGDDFDPQVDRVLAGVLLPVVVTHEGGRPGVISDIIVQMSLGAENDNWIFEPMLFADEHDYFTSFDAASLVKSMQAAFSPLAVAKGEQVKRFVVFQCTEHARYPGCRLRLGRYRMNVFVRVGPSGTYKLCETIGVDFSRDVLQGLDVARYAPPPESLIRARQQLRDSLTR